jgi:1-deoxy-D-xylulose-5-phosphate reductoisomerase
MNSDPRTIALIGATGSIGQNTLAVIRAHPDRLKLVAAAVASNATGLDRIGQEFGLSSERMVLYSQQGEEGLLELVTLPEVDIVVLAATGTACLKPALAAIKAGKTIALANKEILVMAGRFIMQAAREKGVQILPVDSEHNAIFQCLQGSNCKDIRRLILTASGGPFREFSLEQMRSVTPEQALRHPNWNMGNKITIDSASMANKGLEMIEARWLFGVTPDAVQAVIHPQSIVHSMVEFVDGSILAQLSPPSMTFAIQHCLLYPERADGVQPTLDFSQLLSLDFKPTREDLFPCLRLAREVMQAEGAAPVIFNAANDVAVAAFLQNRISFLAIAELIEHCLQKMSFNLPATIEDTIRIDQETRRFAEHFLSEKS